MGYGIVTKIEICDNQKSISNNSLNDWFKPENSFENRKRWISKKTIEKRMSQIFYTWRNQFRED